MIKVYESIMKVYGEEKKVWLINYEKDKTKKTVPPSIHHIQIIDRSGSMCDDIDTLIEDCKKTITQMRNDDYYTIIWFSSNGQYRTLLKGIKNDEANRESSFRLLDSIKSTLGCTCFSESVKEAETIVDELAALCPNFSITLFTDGEAVTPWSDVEEYSRVETVINRLVNKIVAFNTIGYGNYCNETVLQKWATMSEFGEFIHSNNIEEYHKIFEENTNRVRNLENDTIKINCKNNPIYYATNNSISCHFEELTLNHSDKSKNQFIIVGDKNENLSFTFNDEVIDKKSVKSIAKTWVDGILYKIAYAEYCFGDRYKALKTLGTLRDKRFIDGIKNSFTPDEIADFKKDLKNATFRSVGRGKNTAPENYIPNDDTPCLIDLLTILSQNKENKYAVTSNYSRIGRKTEDSFNMFKKTEGTIYSSIENISFNEKKLNISIGFEIPGHVSINPKQAKKLDLPENYPCKIFRNHTIVKDGYLNMNEIKFKVNNQTYKDICEKFKDVEFMTANNINDENNWFISFDLTKIPVINANYAKTSIEEVFDLVCKENMLKAQLKLAKALVEPKVYEISKYNEEQCALLDEYGIKNGIYNGIKTSVSKAEDSDFYMARVFELNLKGFSSLSPIKMEDGKPTLTKTSNGDAYLVQAITNYYDYSSESVMNYIKSSLSEVRARLAGIRIAMIMTGQWFDISKLSDTKKDEVKTYSAEDKWLHRNFTMNIKTTFEKVYFN